MNLRERLKSKIDNSSAWLLIIGMSAFLIFFTIKGTKKVEALSIVVDDSSAAIQQALNQDDAPEKPKMALSYEQMIAMYKDRRIQFGQNCQATPSNMTYKNGTSVMLDNRSTSALSVNINGVVSVPSYGFKIVKLSSSTLPKTILVDCGKQQNVATILLQK